MAPDVDNNVLLFFFFFLYQFAHDVIEIVRTVKL